MAKNSINKSLIILGMHRSGTSAFAGVLSKMNIFMGNDLYAAQKGVNEKGFFENSKIVELNEQIFDILSSSWDDPLGAQVSFSDLEALHTIKKKAIRIINNEYHNKSFWGIKDPRTSVLLPFWQSVFDELSTKAYYIVMVRHPMEVCRSLQKRDQFSQTKSLILWLNYTLSSLQMYNSSNYQILLYDELISDTEASISRIIKNIDTSLLPNVKDASNFISNKLRNHQSSFDLDANNSDKILELSKRLYDVVNQSEFDFDAIEKIRSEFLEHNKNLNGVINEHSQQIKKSEVTYRLLFNEAYNSLWWKAVWPLRIIEKMLTRFFSAKN